MSLLLALTSASGTSYSLACDAGSYTVAGQASGLSIGKAILCDAGSYLIDGKDAALSYAPAAGTAYSLACNAGSYAVTGQAIGLQLTALSSPAGKRKKRIEIDDRRVFLTKKPLSEAIEEALEKLDRVQDKAIKSYQEKIQNIVSVSVEEFHRRESFNAIKAQDDIAKALIDQQLLDQQEEELFIVHLMAELL